MNANIVDSLEGEEEDEEEVIENHILVLTDV